MQCLKKLCHDFRHEIGFHLIYVDLLFSTIIFCYPIGKFPVIFVIFPCLHLDLLYAHWRMVSESLELWLPTRPL